MSYAELTVQESSRIKRWSHRARFGRTLEAGAVAPGERIVDYGAGNGHLLTLLRDAGPGEMWAFEPILMYEARELLGASATVVERPEDLPGDYFDKAFCLEVLEHLPSEVLDEALANMHRILKPGGKAIITVPIEIGASSVFKNAVRLAAGKPHAGTTPAAMLYSALGMTDRVGRIGGGHFESHIGFDYRRLPALFRRHGFAIHSRGYSPVPALGSIMNSQVVFVLAKAAEAG